MIWDEGRGGYYKMPRIQRLVKIKLFTFSSFRFSNSYRVRMTVRHIYFVLKAIINISVKKEALPDPSNCLLAGPNGSEESDLPNTNTITTNHEKHNK